MKQGQPYYDANGKEIKADITFDFREEASEVMYAVDRALKKHGLALEYHETESDFFAYSIVEVKKK